MPVRVRLRVIQRRNFNCIYNNQLYTCVCVWMDISTDVNEWSVNKLSDQEKHKQCPGMRELSYDFGWQMLVTYAVVRYLLDLWVNQK